MNQKPYDARTLFHAARVCRIHAARHRELARQLAGNPTYVETQKKRCRKSLELAEVFTHQARTARAEKQKSRKSG